MTGQVHGCHRYWAVRLYAELPVPGGELAASSQKLALCAHQSLLDRWRCRPHLTRAPQMPSRALLHVQVARQLLPTLEQLCREGHAQGSREMAVDALGEVWRAFAPNAKALQQVHAQLDTLLTSEDHEVGSHRSLRSAWGRAGVHLNLQWLSQGPQVPLARRCCIGAAGLRLIFADSADWRHDEMDTITLQRVMHRITDAEVAMGSSVVMRRCSCPSSEPWQSERLRSPLPNLSISCKRCVQLLSLSHRRVPPSNPMISLHKAHHLLSPGPPPLFCPCHSTHPAADPRQGG